MTSALFEDISASLAHHDTFVIFAEPLPGWRSPATAEGREVLERYYQWFAPAKAAQRSLVESMARHLWPQRVHVALIIVDGVVDLPKARAFMHDKPDDFFIQPDAVAETAYRLTTQPASARSFEVEARPFGETWQRRLQRHRGTGGLGGRVVDNPLEQPCPTARHRRRAARCAAGR